MPSGHYAEANAKDNPIVGYVQESYALTEINCQ